MKSDHKQLKRDYQQSLRPMGIFLIRNNRTDQVFLGSSTDLPGIINRHKSQLRLGGHPNKALQSDWNELGEQNFAFEIVDELTAEAGVKRDYREELRVLEEMWLERLKPFGERGYNIAKLSRAELLRRIAENSREDREL
jgi:hypothetical protein